MCPLATVGRSVYSAAEMDAEGEGDGGTPRCVGSEAHAHCRNLAPPKHATLRADREAAALDSALGGSGGAVPEHPPHKRRIHSTRQRKDALALVGDRVGPTYHTLAKVEPRRRELELRAKPLASNRPAPCGRRWHQLTRAAESKRQLECMLLTGERREAESERESTRLTVAARRHEQTVGASRGGGGRRNLVGGNRNLPDGDGGCRPCEQQERCVRRRLVVVGDGGSEGRAGSTDAGVVPQLILVLCHARRASPRR